MMTLLLVFDALQSGKLQANQVITVSQRAASMPASKLGLRPGSKIRVTDAISSLATLSANDMAVALAEAVGGSESQFAQKMTARAAELNMSRTRFYNASGLPNGYQVTTARDMARLARYTLAHYPGYAQVYSHQSFTYAGKTYSNHNHLMETYSGMDCCKTGYINASGFNLVASAKRNGNRVIGVVFGGRTTVSRNMEMASLLDDGFDKTKQIQTASAQKTPAVSQPPSQNARAAAPEAPAKIEKNVVLASTAITASPAPAPKHVAVHAAAMTQSAMTGEPLMAIKTLNPSYPKADEKIELETGDDPESLPVAAATQPAQVASLSPAAASQPVPAPASTGLPVPPVTASPVAYTPSSAAPGAAPATVNKGWAIQIGAYQTRLATDQAIGRAEQKLPQRLRKNQSVVVPLRTADASWMFRARLSGFTQSEAAEACQYFKDCLAISPQAY
jgi:D-alanyl-D-alanine carboxypeptidase